MFRPVSWCIKKSLQLENLRIISFAFWDTGFSQELRELQLAGMFATVRCELVCFVDLSASREGMSSWITRVCIAFDHWRLLTIWGSIRGHLADCLWLSKKTLSAQRNFGTSVHRCSFREGGLLGCTPLVHSVMFLSISTYYHYIPGYQYFFSP